MWLYPSFCTMLCALVLLTKSTGVLTPAPVQTVQIRAGPLWELGSAPCFAADHVWPSWADWQDLFTGGEARGERDGERGNLRESSRYTRNGNPSFYTWPVFFKSLFSLCLPHPFSLSETGYSLLRACVFFPFISQLHRRHWNLVCFGLAS